MLSEIPVQEFQAIKQQGFDIVWMMGVWQLGEYGLNYGMQQVTISYMQIEPIQVFLQSILKCFLDTPLQILLDPLMRVNEKEKWKLKDH